MAVRKTQVVSFEGSDIGDIGDILYWDGSNWVRLPASDDGKRLVTHGVGSSPSWEWLICNGSIVWYTPGGSWHIGPYIGKVWYKTTTYEGTDPAQAALDTWESLAPEYDPVPTSIIYDDANSQFIISGGGIPQANNVYKSKGFENGVRTFGNPAWDNNTPSEQWAQGTGGTVSYFGDYKIHTFTSSDTFTCTSPGLIEYLIVGGGGSGGCGWGFGGGNGGNQSGGGGGAGGILSGTTEIIADSHSIIIGNGGASVTGSFLQGNKGEDSIAFGLTGLGGGAGRASGDDGSENGGCGGGGGANNPVHGIGSQGFNGGDSGGYNTGGGGGGGMGTIGLNNSGPSGGNGGSGIAKAISGISTYYSGGGGGSKSNGGSNGSGGIGGGGAGDGSSGILNTGGGGGGGWGIASGAGGSGIVIVRYKIEQSSSSSSSSSSVYPIISSSSSSSSSSFDIFSCNFRDPNLDATIPNLLHAWKFEESSGQILDYVVGENLTTFGSPIYQSVGKDGSCLTYNGSSDYCHNVNVQLPAAGFTVSFWQYNTASTGSFRRWFTNNIGGFDANTVLLREQSSGTIYLEGPGIGQDSGVQAIRNAWTHIMIINDGVNFSVYQNNIQIISFAANGPLTQGIYFGGFYQPSNSEYFQGRMDELYIWNTSLNLIERTALYNTGIGKFLTCQEESSSSSSSSSSSIPEESMWWCVDVEPSLPGCITPIGPIEQRCMLGPIVIGSCCFDGINWWKVIGINTGPYPTPDCLFACEPLVCIPEPSSSSSSSSSTILDPLPKDTVFYSHLDGDMSDSRHDITLNGGIVIGADDGLYGGSYHLDGSNDYLSVQGSLSDFEFGSGEFAIEMRLYFDGTFLSSSRSLMGKGGGTADWGSSGHEWLMWIERVSSSDYKLWLQYNTGPTNKTSSNFYAHININGWNKIRVAQDSSNFKMFINDNEVYSSSTISITKPTTSDKMHIGTTAALDAPYCYGRLDEVKVWKGGSLISNIVLHLNMNGDISNGQHDITTIDGQIINSGGGRTNFNGAYEFDGSADKLSMPYNTDFVFSGDFVLACWINSTSGQNQQTLFGFDGVWNNNPRSFALIYDWGALGSTYNNRVCLGVNNGGGGTNAYRSTTELNDGNWHHVALVRSGSSVNVYIDGTSEISFSDSSTWGISSGEILYIGGATGGSPNNFGYFNGQMDEPLIINGSDNGWTGSTIEVPTCPYGESCLSSLSSSSSSSSLYSSSSSQTTPGYIVSNAGTTEVNGAYYLEGTYGGKNYYFKTNGWYLYYAQTSEYWVINTSLNDGPPFESGWAYRTDGFGYSMPPLTGWSVADGGSSPAPTLSEV